MLIRHVGVFSGINGMNILSRKDDELFICWLFLLV